MLSFHLCENTLDFKTTCTREIGLIYDTEVEVKLIFDQLNVSVI